MRLSIVFVFAIAFETLLFVGCRSSNRELSNSYSRLDRTVGEPLCVETYNLPEICHVSLHAVVANPERYHGMRIQVLGYVTLGFEDNVVYPSSEAARIGDSLSALWLDVEGLAISDTRKYHRQWVLVAGTFNGENRGHLGSCAGTIESIVRFDLAHDR